MVLHFEKSCVFNLLAFFAFTVTTAVVIVQDGGYQNVVVTFSPDITKDDQSKVLAATKDLMKLSSNAVYRATGICFGNVVFLLPYTWDNLDSLLDVENITYSSANQVYYDANIFVENADDTVYGTYPYTLQRGGCGTQGVRITIPKGFLLHSDNDVEGEKAKIIAREWIRYRYGVFYENGYPNDDRYPLYFSHPGSYDPADIHITGCTDRPVNYTFKNSAQQECSLSVDASGRPDGQSATCKFHPQENEDNSRQTSSLMFMIDLPSVVYLCDDQDHVHSADVPNKQNSLCNGRSIWNVMKDHPDFENREIKGSTDAPPDLKFKVIVDGNPRIVLPIGIYVFGFRVRLTESSSCSLPKMRLDAPDRTLYHKWNYLDLTKIGGKPDPPPDPKFKVVVDGIPRIVLAIDLSTTIAANTKILVGKATEKFIFDLPDETEFSLFVYDSSVERRHEKIALRGSRPEVNLSFNRRVKPCPRCAIREALEVLTDENPGSKGTIVIMSSTDSVGDVADLSNQLSSSQICLVVILYGSNNSSEGFQELLNASPCSHVWIMPSAEGLSALHVLTQLNKELEDVIKNQSYYNSMYTMYTVETTSISETNPVSFTTDRSIKVFQIRLTSMQESLNRAFDDSDVKLTNGECKTFEPPPRNTNFKQFRTYEVSASECYSWNFEIKNIDESALSGTILLQVVAKGSNSKSLRVRSWIEDTTTKEASENSEQLPVILYTEVTMGINPVLNAKIQAVVATPSQETSKIDLLDNGLGDPDVTKYDGIYSRYFTQFTSEGDYQVTITVIDNEGSSQTAQPPESVKSQACDQYEEYNGFCPTCYNNTIQNTKFPVSSIQIVLAGPSMPCCGSFIPSGTKEQTGPFNRTIKTNFHARSGRPSKGYKPSRVQDLLLLSWVDRNLKFQWTSPGNEMDEGAAKEYMFRLFETRQEAETNFENFTRDAFAKIESIIPMNYLSRQTVEVQLNESLATGKNYFFAMRSESQEGRQSDTSNVVQLFIPAVVTSPPPTKDAIETTDENGNKAKTSSVDGKITGIIVGVCVLLIIIFICAYLAFYLIIVRPKRKRNEDEGSSNAPGKISRDINEDKGDGTEPANEWQMENKSISPINSWPSNVLVNHHEKVKAAKRKNEKPPVFTLEQLETSSDEISTISNGLLPNPIYSSHAEDLNDHATHTSTLPLQDNDNARPSRRVTHV